jgi:Fe-S cluster assembly scaffold protein SufB
MVEEGLTMDFAIHDHKDEQTTAVITSLVELLGHISNHLGSPINFDDKPIKINKPKSKKVDVGGTLFNDEPLGSKSLPRQAGKPNKPQSISKESKPVNMDYTSSVTGGMFEKEDIDEAVDEVMQSDDEEKLLPQAVAATIGGEVADSYRESMERKSMNAMTTSEGKQLLKLLEDAVEKLSKFVNTTRIPAQSAQRPSDVPVPSPKF